MAIEEDVEVKEFTTIGGWNKQKLATKLSEEMVEYITESKKPPFNEHQPDFPSWMSSKQGNFTIFFYKGNFVFTRKWLFTVLTFYCKNKQTTAKVLKFVL